NGVESGQAFKNCLGSLNDTTSYDLLLKYPFSSSSVINSGEIIELCW
ncbi:2747_t:CDS:1, partial [Racocetra persica]